MYSVTLKSDRLTGRYIVTAHEGKKLVYLSNKMDMDETMQTLIHMFSINESEFFVAVNEMHKEMDDTAHFGWLGNFMFTKDSQSEGLEVQ